MEHWCTVWYKKKLDMTKLSDILSYDLRNIIIVEMAVASNWGKPGKEILDRFIEDGRIVKYLDLLDAGGDQKAAAFQSGIKYTEAHKIWLCPEFHALRAERKANLETSPEITVSEFWSKREKPKKKTKPILKSNGTPRQDREMSLQALRLVVSDPESSNREVVQASIKLTELADRELAKSEDNYFDIPTDEHTKEAIQTDIKRLMAKAV